MTEFNEDVFDEKKIKKAIKKGKIKTIITIIIVSLTVFISLNILNNFISYRYSQKAYKEWDAYVRLTTPNGYISKTIDSKGFLGGISNYKISKDMKIKSVVIEENQYTFGLSPSTLISRGSTGSVGITGEDWQFMYKENGWREMMFFHPNVTYKKYSNVEELINRLQEDKIYEVAISFDKPYKQSELPFIELPEMTWFWINTFTDSQIETFQREASENDWSSTFIREKDALGFSINSEYYAMSDLESDYEYFLELLQTSVSDEHKKAFDTIKGTDIQDNEILGIIIYGTKEQVLEIMKNPIVKASSLGGIVDNY